MAKDANLSVALVTGAASGIGQELAHLLAKDQHQLILVDQNPGGLQAFAEHLQSKHNEDLAGVIFTAWFLYH